MMLEWKKQVQSMFRAEDESLQAKRDHAEVKDAIRGARFWIVERLGEPPYRGVSICWLVKGVRPIDSEYHQYYGPYPNAPKALEAVSARFGTSAAENATEQYYH